jgi:hypothetical protein
VALKITPILPLRRKGFRPMSKNQESPYLKPNRLQDVLSAMQTMSLYHRYRLPFEEWAELISGEEGKVEHWKLIFDEHPEFFRKSAAFPGHYALIWRRALSNRWHMREQRYVTEEEYKVLRPQRHEILGRQPIPEAQIKTLMDTAMQLHQRAIEAHRDRRWWLPISATVLGSVMSLCGAFLGAILGKGH